MNTSAYNPQTDGLVEQFNRTLTDMLAKLVTSPQESVNGMRNCHIFSSPTEPLFRLPLGNHPFLLYGRNSRLPTETVLSPPTDPLIIHLDDYKSTLVCEMSLAWNRAQDSVGKAQKRQKAQYNKMERNSEFNLGHSVFVSMPAKKTGHMRKLACPFQSPYRVLHMYPNGLLDI